MTETESAHYLEYFAPEDMVYTIEYAQSLWWYTIDKDGLRGQEGSVSLEQASTIGAALDYVVRNREGG